MKRKISECINVQINVGNYQHIAITKYAEEEIEYSTNAERVQKEDELTASLVESLTRSMKAIPEKLGKGVEQAIEVEQAIKKTIPEWLAKNPVPNIANNAKKQNNKIINEQQDQKAQLIAKNQEDLKHLEENKKVSEITSQKEDNLFEDDSQINQETPLAKEANINDQKDFFADADDLFDDK